MTKTQRKKLEKHIEAYTKAQILAADTAWRSQEGIRNLLNKARDARNALAAYLDELMEPVDDCR